MLRTDDNGELRSKFASFGHGWISVRELVLWPLAAVVVGLLLGFLLKPHWLSATIICVIASSMGIGSVVWSVRKFQPGRHPGMYGIAFVALIMRGFLVVIIATCISVNLMTLLKL